MPEFGPWRVWPDSPDLGDYIQAEGPAKDNGQVIRVEGIVSAICPFRGIHVVPPLQREIILSRWRLRRLPEHKIETTREKEIEDA